MKKILLSCVTCLLAVGLLAGCDDKEEVVTPDEPETTVPGEGGDTESGTTPETTYDHYVLVGDFVDASWDTSVDETSPYYLALSSDPSENYWEITVTIADQPEFGDYDSWQAGLRVATADWKVTVAGYSELTESSDSSLTGDNENNVKVEWGKTYNIIIDLTGESPALTVNVEAYKLGALDTSKYEYVYFSGEASGNYLGVTSSWKDAAPVTFEEVTSEEEGFTAVSISFVDAEGATKYISRASSASSSSNVEIADEPYAWYWNETNTVFAAGSSDGRALVYYAATPSFRAYAQNDNNLKNPHVAVYTKAQKNPEVPETPELAQVTSGLTDNGTYYIGEYEDDAYHLITGAVTSGTYRLSTSVDFDAVSAVTATGSDEDGWVLTLSSGQCIYGYYANTYLDFGVCDVGDVPEGGTNKFFWNSDAKTLYTETSSMSSYTATYRATTYSYAYFEWYSTASAVCLYGTNDVSIVTNAAHVYQLVEED